MFVTMRFGVTLNVLRTFSFKNNPKIPHKFRVDISKYCLSNDKQKIVSDPLMFLVNLLYKYKSVENH